MIVQGRKEGLPIPIDIATRELLTREVQPSPEDLAWFTSARNWAQFLLKMNGSPFGLLNGAGRLDQVDQRIVDSWQIQLPGILNVLTPVARFFFLSNGESRKSAERALAADNYLANSPTKQLK